MPEFNLNLLIDPNQDLPLIKAAQLNIILAKPIGGGAPNVAWQSFDPFPDNNVEWTEEYGLYASTTQVNNGARITKMSTTGYPAQSGAYYSFTSNATFNGPITDGNVPPANSYKIVNDMPSSQYPALTFGLMQSASINGVAAQFRPINAQTVLSKLDVTFTPLTTVYVWLQAQLVSETVITSVTSRHTKVTFGGPITSHTLKYDRNTGMFVAVSGKEKAFIHDAPNVELVRQAIA
ncbi:MAG: hypothetical protein AB1489_14780 [Acidobacteriota bacterium]